MSTTPAIPAVKPPASDAKRAGWPWAVAVIFALFILTCGALAFYVIRGMFGFVDSAGNIPEKFGKSLAENFSPQTTFTTEINSTIGAIKHTPKLIVNTYDIDVEVQEAATSTWAYVYWGTTEVSVRAHKNKIQYYVPVDMLSTGNFTYDADHKILHALIPLPRLDEDVVEVQSNPQMMEFRTSVGWASTDSGAGKALREDVLTKLRAAVVSAGKGEAQQALAEKDARINFAHLLDPVVQALGTGVKVEIDFEPAPKP
jgi:hypothetical protein